MSGISISDKDKERGIIDDLQSVISSHFHGREHFAYKPTKQSFKISFNVKYIYLTLVGGGGSGAIGHQDHQMMTSGGGGGAGGCIMGLPIPVEHNMVVDIHVGKGGITKDGESTIVELIYKGGIRRITVEGGKHACGVEGGKGGASPFTKKLYGDDGEDGNIQLPSCAVIHGGNGGSTYFGRGGYGGYVGDNVRADGLDGYNGSGGGGGCVGEFVRAGTGGDGFVVIEW
jgi:hypothetical protein